MPYFLRIVEQPDGWWFRRSRDDIKRFEEVDEAVGYATQIARNDRPGEVLVHRLDGRVTVIAKFE